MNQLDEQKRLIEYLEAALAEAHKVGVGNEKQIVGIEEDLRLARLEYERMSGPGQPVQPAIASLESQHTVRPVDPPIFRELHPTSRFKNFLESFKLVFGHETKVYRISAQPIEANLMLQYASRFQVLKSNLRASLGLQKKNYSNLTSTPISTDLLLDERSWISTFFADLKSFFAPAGLGDLKITAQPVEVGEIFREYKFRSRSVVYSVVVHVMLVGLSILLPILWVSTKKAPTTSTEIYFFDPDQMSLPAQAKKSGGGGGGGDQSKTPPSQGKLPKLADRQLVPPTTHIINPNPIMPEEPTLTIPQLSQIPMVNLPNIGDPKGMPGPPSNGPGMYGGIGTGSGGGIGPGRGSGYGPGEGGGIGGGVFRVGGGVSAPVPIYRVEPNFSEEARKAKYQGVVVLQAVVRKDGTVEIIRVVRGLGLGLDENAIAALKQWKFRPGTKNGVPVDVSINIEVNFTLR